MRQLLLSAFVILLLGGAELPALAQQGGAANAYGTWGSQNTPCRYCILHYWIPTVYKWCLIHRAYPLEQFVDRRVPALAPTTFMSPEPGPVPQSFPVPGAGKECPAVPGK
jgi:hypothetical protein